jgi:hypothetical protein
MRGRAARRVVAAFVFVALFGASPIVAALLAIGSIDGVAERLVGASIVVVSFGMAGHAGKLFAAFVVVAILHAAAAAFLIRRVYRWIADDAGDE